MSDKKLGEEYSDLLKNNKEFQKERKKVLEGANDISTIVMKHMTKALDEVMGKYTGDLGIVALGAYLTTVFDAYLAGTTALLEAEKEFSLILIQHTQKMINLAKTTEGDGVGTPEDVLKELKRRFGQ